MVKLLGRGCAYIELSLPLTWSVLGRMKSWRELKLTPVVLIRLSQPCLVLWDDFCPPAGQPVGSTFPRGAGRQIHVGVIPSPSCLTFRMIHVPTGSSTIPFGGIQGSGREGMEYSENQNQMRRKKKKNNTQ